MKKNMEQNLDAMAIQEDFVMQAVVAKDNEKLAALVAKGSVDLNRKNSESQTPLACALLLKDLRAAETLIEAGADVNCVDALGFTLLHVTIKMCEDYLKDGHTQEEIFALIKRLASRGIKFDYQDRRGNSPINMVAQRAKPNKSMAELYTRMGKLLLSLDQNAPQTVQLRNNMGKSSLDYLAKNGNFLLRDAIYEKLPHVQDMMKSEIKRKEMEVKKFISLDKETV